MDESRTCARCGETKSLNLFPAQKRVSIKFNKNYKTYCKACNAERAREFRKLNPGYKTTGKVVKIAQEDRPLMSAIRQRLADARGRCKKLGRPAPTVTDDYLYGVMLRQGRACAITGAMLSLEKGHPLCLSLDKIDPKRGYEEGNVQWLAWCVNRAKGDLSLDQFYELCEVALEYRNVQRLSKGVKQLA